MMCGLYWEYPWFCVNTAVYVPVLSGMYNFIYYQYSPSEMMCGLYWEYPLVLCHSLLSMYQYSQLYV